MFNVVLVRPRSRRTPQRHPPDATPAAAAPGRRRSASHDRPPAARRRPRLPRVRRRPAACFGGPRSRDERRPPGSRLRLHHRRQAKLRRRPPARRDWLSSAPRRLGCGRGAGDVRRRAHRAPADAPRAAQPHLSNAVAVAVFEPGARTATPAESSPADSRLGLRRRVSALFAERRLGAACAASVARARAPEGRRPVEDLGDGGDDRHLDAARCGPGETIGAAAHALGDMAEAGRIDARFPAGGELEPPVAVCARGRRWR